MRRRTLIIAGVFVVGLVGFLLFRPDTYFFDIRADEDLQEAFVTTTSPIPGTTQEVTPREETETTTTSPSAATTTAQITTVSVGSFYGIEHRASGTATVYESDGRYVLRFEDDTDIQNGPDLYVWVLPDEDYAGGNPEEYIDLGKLTGNVGGQNYDLPDEFDPTIHRAVLIWCLRFAVPFAAVPLGST